MTQTAAPQTYVVTRTISGDVQVRLGGQTGTLIRNFGKKRAAADKFAAAKNAEAVK